MKDAKQYVCETCEAQPGSECYWEPLAFGTPSTGRYHRQRVLLALSDPSDSVGACHQTDPRGRACGLRAGHSNYHHAICAACNYVVPQDSDGWHRCVTAVKET